MVDYAPYPQPLGMDGLQDALPSLQIGDDSSPSKPDDYRIAPIIPQDPDDSSASDVTLTAASVIEVKPALQLVLQDWSGRGAHVDFQPHEQVPLREHRFLGQGSMGPVYETAVRGHVFAWKRRFCRRHIGEAERKELEILKKVSHNHIIQLAGSYTHQQFLGLLLYPVAAYDLATLLEETEMVVNNRADLLASQCEKLGLLCGLGALRPNREGGYMEMVRNEIEDRLIPFVLSKIGCIISAVEYLHSQRIRHKDLKPSNILLSQDGLWLTDFGTATDFSLQTISTTENWERGTPKYFAPEMASYQPSGRAADIFSLGCVVLEMYTAVQPDLPEHLRQLRSAHDKSFQANLETLIEWLRPEESAWDQQLRRRRLHEVGVIPWDIADSSIEVRREIFRMLAKDADKRPLISQVRTYFALVDTLLDHRGESVLFGACCSRPFISADRHEEAMLRASQTHEEEMGKMKAEHHTEMEQLQASLIAYQEQEKRQIIRDHDLEVADLKAKLAAATKPTAFADYTAAGGNPFARFNNDKYNVPIDREKSFDRFFKRDTGPWIPCGLCSASIPSGMIAQHMANHQKPLFGHANSSTTQAPEVHQKPLFEHASDSTTQAPEVHQKPLFGHANIFTTQAPKVHRKPLFEHASNSTTQAPENYQKPTFGHANNSTTRAFTSPAVYGCEHCDWKGGSYDDRMRHVDHDHPMSIR